MTFRMDTHGVKGGLIYLSFVVFVLLWVYTGLRILDESLKQKDI